MMYDVYGDYTHVCNYNNEKILEHLKLQPTYIFGTTGRRVTKKKTTPPVSTPSVFIPPESSGRKYQGVLPIVKNHELKCENSLILAKDGLCYEPKAV
jgi:hypothetical protein